MKDKYYYSDGSTSSEIDYSKQLHRVDGPAIEYPNGHKAWYLNGKLHRIDGPAIEWADGTKWWYLNGRHHRIDGPAREWSNGSKDWFLNGERYTEEEFNNTIKEVNEMCLSLLLTDTREWVRELGRKRSKE